jgi:hypothetical protein
MNSRIHAPQAFVRVLAVVFVLYLGGIASAQTASRARRAGLTSALRTESPRSKTPGPAPVPPWPPADVDEFVPAVSSNQPCSLPQVLSRAGHRIEQLVGDLDKFTATEVARHHKVDKAGHLQQPETSRFDYLVFLSQRRSGLMNVEEYRKGHGAGDQFPDHVATEGTPTLVLIFHPIYVKNFSMSCEGLGDWHGKPAWQVRFEQRDPRASMITMVIASHAYNVKIRGRAWILADSYEVARLETDLAENIPAIRLRLDHQSVEYSPVRFPKSKVEIWLPSSTELYMDFQGHRFYRRHTFTDFNLFSVRIDQQFGDPK